MHCGGAVLGAAGGGGWGGGVDPRGVDPLPRICQRRKWRGEGRETDREKVGNPKKFKLTASRLCAGDLAGKKVF